jgi:hypothetical protein
MQLSAVQYSKIYNGGTPTKLRFVGVPPSFLMKNEEEMERTEVNEMKRKA